ncbi:TlyA family RNA methyltransferase [Acholeplasma granularum]|uniref:TlyA family RNA methyltransferase n=1 Tax=Acholeplasma granularum TaxID=264635 RepID=UPI0004729E56|nr:TlyA family RNA methyltransferase [Acholeplasma granularum]
MRLDVYLTTKYPEYTRSKLSDLIKRGFVTVNGNQIIKPGFIVDSSMDIKLTKKDIFVSRAGEKLDDALDLFNLSVTNFTVIDVGASTGGFTQSVLSRGANHVYAYDVGKNQLDEKLKEDKRVTSFEETNILDVNVPSNDLIVIDVSFTSVLPILTHLSTQTSQIIFLLKPQFEGEIKHLKKGILKSEKIINQIIENTTKHINYLNYKIKGFTKSIIKGKEGNQEYIFYITKG